MIRQRMVSAVIWVVVLVVSVLASSPGTATQEKADAQTLAEGNTTFAFDLYGRLKAPGGNVFFSPYSLSTALATVYGGARGHTKNHMAEVLNFTLDQERLHSTFAHLAAQVHAAQETAGIELHTANALWIQQDYRFRSAFVDLTTQHYGVGLHRVDFKAAHEAARQKINTWVEKETRQHINDLIQPGVVNPNTRFVLTNAIYFKGKWQWPFAQRRTQEMPFWLAPGLSVQVPMMMQQQKFPYGERDRLQILELPYVGNELSMIVLLPKDVGGVDQLDRELSVHNLQMWHDLSALIAGLQMRHVQVFLPRFTIHSQFRLDKQLAAMGMPDAFRNTADFSGMDGTHALFLTAALHNAFVEVNEEGTEAAAATGVGGGIRGVTASPVVFRADRPFVFLIRHKPSGSVLFLGRLMNPTR